VEINFGWVTVQMSFVVLLNRVSVLNTTLPFLRSGVYFEVIKKALNFLRWGGTAKPG
jgi:hypothetical protein